MTVAILAEAGGTTALGPIGRVGRVAEDAAAGHWLEHIPWWVWGLLALGVLLVAAWGSWIAWRDQRRRAPVERGFRRLARRLGLGRADRDVVRSMAQLAGLPPAALLLSEQAYLQGEARLETGALRMAALAARKRIFGETP
ncbi:MAG: hypothetical protein IBJ11_09430 [Phycisphaerales bacterium]|nr:hypothetical protein [Phycisphaerales bacterium]